jgi:O-antigen/teichoic acid export membrane protein
MVPPFQVLLVVGIGQALVNIVAEFLGGRGHVAFRVRVTAVWALATVVLMWLLVPAYGIKGAAVSHAVLFVPLAGVYAVRGGRLLGVSLARLAGALRSIVLVSGVEAAATAAVWAGLGRLSVGAGTKATVAAAAGLGLACLLLSRDPDGALADAREVVAARLNRRAAAVG